MRRILIVFLQILLCGLMPLACHHANPRSTSSPPPPETSYRVESLSLTTDGTSKVIPVAFVRPEFIEASHAQPALGRSFIDDDYRPRPQGVALLSHGLWRRQYKSNPQIVGMNVILNGRAYTVIGVMPKAFKHPREAEIWVPDETK